MNYDQQWSVYENHALTADFHFMNFILKYRAFLLLACFCAFAPMQPASIPEAGRKGTNVTSMKKPLIYQIFTRLYGNQNTENQPHGTLEQNGCAKMNDFTAAQLKRIADFGFTHVWYTGLIEHATQTDYSAYGIQADHPAVVKGMAGSPYAIKDYYDVDPDLAVDVPRRMKEFENLVRRTHKAGLKMVIDFVPNHVARQYKSDACPAGVRDLGADDDTAKAFDPQNNFYYVLGQPLHTDFDTERKANAPYKEYPAKVTGNDHFGAWPSRNDWYETVKLNYGIDYLGGRSTHFVPTPSTWEKMTDILLFWAKKGVDAFRCDMAEMVPVEFWAYATARVKEKYPHIQFIAEVYNPAEYRRYIAGGFDYLYDKVGLYDTLRAVVCHGASASSITGCWQAVDDIRGHMLNFLENHDEQRIASAYFAGDARKALPALVVSAMMGGNPFMVYAGQELGDPGMDAEGFSGSDGRTTIFDYWSVPSLRKLTAKKPEEAFTEDEKAIYDYYKRVMQLCRDEKALATGTFYDLQYANYGRECGYNCDRQYAFIRQEEGKGKTLLVVANFDSVPVHAGVRIPQHAFEYLTLRSGLRSSMDLLSGDTQTLELKTDQPVYVDVPAYGAVVLTL